MTFPIQCPRTYVHPDGMISASGYYRASTTQELANMMPPWMHLRENQNSIGQQFLSGTSVHLKRLEKNLNDCMNSKFISTAPVDEIDVIYRVKLPSNVNLTDATASGVRCIAAPSGCSPSGVDQIWIKEITDIETFYYHTVPTRFEVEASGVYSTEEIGSSWNIIPSGVVDLEEVKIDVWKTEHDISWCYANGYLRKQDVETMEDYELYTPPTGYGTIVDIDYHNGNLWCLSSDGVNTYVNILSSKTYMPVKQNLDLIASFDLTGGVSAVPTNIVVKDASNVYLKSGEGDTSYLTHPRYDYFLLDKDNRYVYLKEDYTDSGVFISNT